MRAADKWDSPRFQAVFWAQASSVKAALSCPTHQRVTPAVRPHVFSFSRFVGKMVRLVKSAFFAFARKRVFPAIVFSAVWFIHQGSGLISFVSSLSCLACQKVLHFSSRDCQVDFVGYGFFGCGVLPAVVS